MKSLLTALLLVTATALVPVHAGGLEGRSAPAFSLPDQHGEMRTLDSFVGRWLVLYFYPKDNTPGCTIEARNFVRDYSKFTALNAEIVGVSLDDVASHKAFADTVGARFLLLADTEKIAAKAYNVLTSFGPVEFTKRQTFVINPAGLIVKHYQDVDADEHAGQLLTDLAALQH